MFEQTLGSEPSMVCFENVSLRSVKMPKCSMVVSVTLLALFLSIASSASAAAEDWGAIHRRMGATGKNGYRPMSSHAYQSTARVHARALHSYGQNIEQVPVETVQEHLTQIKTNVAATKAEIAKLPPEAVAVPGVKEHLDAISKQLAECEKMCSMADKSAAGAKADNVAMCEHCVGLEKKLKAIQAEEAAMLKKLGIELPKNAEDHGEHEQGKKEKP